MHEYYSFSSHALRNAVVSSRAVSYDCAYVRALGCYRCNQKASRTRIERDTGYTTALKSWLLERVGVRTTADTGHEAQSGEHRDETQRTIRIFTGRRNKRHRGTTAGRIPDYHWAVNGRKAGQEGKRPCTGPTPEDAARRQDTRCNPGTRPRRRHPRRSREAGTPIGDLGDEVKKRKYR